MLEHLLPIVCLFLALVVVVVAARLYFAIAEIARAGDAGHVPGTGSHAGGGRAGEGKSITHLAKSPPDSDDVDARRLRMKRELLERWATEGKPIDAITEAHAELVVLEVESRSNAWRNFTAAAADEPIDAERPFAS